MLLEVKEINTFYGISHILFNVSLEIEKGEVVCILGRNGVGKTTLLRSIMGLTAARSGNILFGGIDIRGKQPFEVARLGIGFVPEDRVIFPALTVIENLEMGTKRGNKQLLMATATLSTITFREGQQAASTLSLIISAGQWGSRGPGRSNCSTTEPRGKRMTCCSG